MTTQTCTCPPTGYYYADNQGYFYYAKPCTLPADSGGSLCILHDPNEAKDRSSFLEALWHKIYIERYEPRALLINLSNVVFPPYFSWNQNNQLSAVIGSRPLQKAFHFQKARFLGNADFSDAQFSTHADFSDAQFSAGANFRGAQFSAGANFRVAQFAADADFSGAKFSAGTNFWGARFSAGTNFWGAQFAADANFTNAEFGPEVSFIDAELRGNTEFWSAKFAGNADFTDAQFSRNVGMVRSTFQNGLVFRRSRFPTSKEEGIVDFRYVTLNNPQAVFFERVNLSQTSFLHTNVSRINFTGVTWPQKPERFWLLPFFNVTHNVLHDQLTLEQGFLRAEEQPAGHLESEAHLVADLYRQLRLNLEGTRQEVEAGHFYIGQMDMRQRDTSILKSYRILLWLYRGIAEYGESVWRPLLLYLFSSLCFAFLYLWCGFVWNGDPLPVQHGPFWSGGLTFPISDYGKAWFIAATAGTLLRNNIQFVGSWGYVVFFLNMVLGIFFIALFIIALRRHFRR